MSEKSIADKLQIKPNTSVWLSDASRLDRVQPLPDCVRVVDGLEHAATALVFAGDSASLRETLNDHKDALFKPAAFWVAYPKANRTDINRDTLWPILVELGMRPIGQVAVDDVWSAQRFRPLKPREAPFTGGGQRG